MGPAKRRWALASSQLLFYFLQAEKVPTPPLELMNLQEQAGGAGAIHPTLCTEMPSLAEAELVQTPPGYRGGAFVAG